MKRTTIGLFVGALLAGQARAQDTATVHIASPYVNFEQRHGVTLFAGYFAGNEGSANVGPQGSFTVGADYWLHVGGPAFVAGELLYAPSKRTIMDPFTLQNLGTVSSPLYMLDVALHVSVTGEKTWHGMLPLVGLGLGVAYDPEKPDVGGYAFGTKFFIGAGAGIVTRISGPWLLRVSAWAYLWQLHYPTTYFPPGNGGIFPPNAADKEWVGNGVFTLGLTYRIAH